MKRSSVSVLAVLACLSTPAIAPAQGIIQTVAGSRWVFRGNGGSALNAPLGRMYGIAADPTATDGTIYVADYDNNIVVKISRGIVTVVAGNGIAGISGDGGPATAASLDSPYGVAVDTAGNLYISQVNRVRKVTPSGIISTYAGNGLDEDCRDGLAATAACW